MTSAVLGVLSGAIFGSGLVVSGVYWPRVMVEQMQWKSFNMLGMFLSASAASALVFSMAKWTHVAPKKVRAASSLGLFPYDGNVVGGALTGAGMAIGGACPGTALAQTAIGIRSGPQVLFGGLLGAIAYVTAKSVARPHPSIPSSSRTIEDRGSNPDNPNHGVDPATISSSLGTSEATTLILWEIMCLVAFAVVLRMPASINAPSLVDALTGGILIGLAQITNIAIFKQPVGVSTAYEDVARRLQKLGTGSVTRKTISGVVTPSTAFAAGILAGAFTLLRTGAVLPDYGNMEITMAPGKAVLTGILLVFGARVAGGCTSGHGISGMAAFSVSSVVTTASMFGSGILTASLMG